MTDQSTYERRRVVQEYAQESDLQPPEAAALALLKNDLPTMRMLDIGVGGGRTTTYFAPLAKEYIGIDFSPQMIEACKVRFPDLARANAFQVADARSMAMFPDDHFDFVLFSFNGIDCVSTQDRVKIFVEIKRITREGGYFLFSTHNLNANIEDGFSVRRAKNGSQVIKQVLRHIIFRVLNPNWRTRRKHIDAMLINDGVHRFRMLTLYAKPDAQISQLMKNGFYDLKLFGRDGRQIQSGTDIVQARDAWLYYLCRTRNP